MRVVKPQYDIDPYSVDWVYRVQNPKRALSIWRKRYQKLLDLSFQYAPHGKYYNQAVRLEVEMYERCAALDWPSTIKMTEEQKWFLQTPPGSFLVNKKIRNANAFYNSNHQYFIGYDPE